VTFREVWMTVCMQNLHHSCHHVKVDNQDMYESRTCAECIQSRTNIGNMIINRLV
jgi:hypothetical protein